MKLSGTKARRPETAKAREARHEKIRKLAAERYEHKRTHAPDGKK